MKLILSGISLYGGICFLTMGVPILLAVGMAGFFSFYVWGSLAAVLVGVAGLGALFLLRRGNKARGQGGEA